MQVLANVLLLIVSGSQEITIDEIGEINDFIQTEAGNSANIIMGVGEDDTLEDSVSVTIIATGFNAEQQHGIVNTEPNRIIHSLEDEQKVVKNLLDKTNFNLGVEAEVVNTIQAESTSSITAKPNPRWNLSSIENAILSLR